MQIVQGEKDRTFFETLKEDCSTEIKKSKFLPKDLWETYSAFSNTNGGTIYLGIKENSPKNIILGVENPRKVIDDFIVTCRNPSKVNYDNSNEENITLINIDGKTILQIDIEEAPLSKKPVFCGGNIENSFIRKGSADLKMTNDELRATFRNAKPDMDSLSAPNTSLDELDSPTINRYRKKFNQQYPNRFESLSDTDFLIRIGAIYLQKNNTYAIKRGTLLFLGKYQSIKKVYPHFHLDYFNRISGQNRWDDRIASDEFYDFEMNVYNFFNIVWEKFLNSFNSPFALDENLERSNPRAIEVSLREALVNCLAHADYEQSYPSIKIEIHNGVYIFENPGQLLIPINQFTQGGESRPRNEMLMSFFRNCGFSERQGFGGQQIFGTSLKWKFRTPKIETDLEKTRLSIWTVKFADSYPDLTEKEILIINYLTNYPNPKAKKEIQEATELSEYHTKQTLDSLCKKEIIKRVGKSVATKYTITRSNQELLTLTKEALNILAKQL